MMNEFKINFDDVSIDSGNFDPLPPGSYKVQCESAEVKKTAKKNGHYINAKLKVVGDKYNGRYLFHTFNIDNPSAKAVQIGKAELKKFIMSSGVLEQAVNNVSIPSGLTNMIVEVDVVISSHPVYGEQNTIKKIKACTPEGLRAMAAYKNKTNNDDSSTYSDPDGANALAPF